MAHIRGVPEVNTPVRTLSRASLGVSVALHAKTELPDIRKIPMAESGKNPTGEGSAAEPRVERPTQICRLYAMCSILLVEDHLDTRRAFAAILRSWGHTVSTADCVAGGLRFLDDNEVDVVLSDIGLPDRNGYDFIAEARQRTPNLTAIAVSAYFTAADQQRGHDAGFDMYFAKPVDLATLERVLERMNSATVFNGNGAAAAG
jgi:CheY-like chemotaxis protein